MLGAEPLCLGLHPRALLLVFFLDLPVALAQGGLRAAPHNPRSLPLDSRLFVRHMLHRPWNHPAPECDPGDRDGGSARGRFGVRRAWWSDGRSHRTADIRQDEEARLPLVPHLQDCATSARVALPRLRQLRNEVRPPLSFREQLRRPAELPLLLQFRDPCAGFGDAGDTVSHEFLRCFRPRGVAQVHDPDRLSHVDRVLRGDCFRSLGNHRIGALVHLMGIPPLPYHDLANNQGVPQKRPQCRRGADIVCKARATTV
mmetsp:Transcript_113124/g.320147  ORF Transcript_113124/g.320147 Transcript_113124/m.320147 type:complete len:257 (-) Transcript_113124:210-980(-)